MTKQEILKATFGYEAFRDGQEELIDALLAGRDAVGIMPTGAGKSVCYQVPALMRPGVALVISPLISLMKDQVAALIAADVPAAYLNSSLTPGQQREALRRATLGWYRVIYVAPERLDAPGFLRFAMEAELSLVAVDEAHCVSQWGQDFRPSYLKIADFIDSLPKRPPVGAFTATATPQVKADVVRMLKLRDPIIRVTGFDRPNLHFASIKPRDKFSALMEIVRRHPGESGIVYCATRKAVEDVCDRLRAEGVSAARYHAGLSDAERMTSQDDFQFDRATVMVATNAFGMGIDKSNVSFVVHYNMPRSMESYYQEAGRAGRDGSPAECVLLYGGQDVMTARWMIEHAEPNPEMTGEEQAELYRRDMERLRQMTFYSTSKKCLRQVLLRYFGEDAPDQCGNCSVCLGEAFVPEKAEEEAVSTSSKAGKAASRLTFRKPAPVSDAVNPELYEALRLQRQQLATEKRVPAYVIFTDATLRDMARLRPHSREALLQVAGVGERKRDRYGDAFLAVLCEHDGVPFTPQGKREEANPGTDRALASVAEPGLAKAGKPWTKEEDERLAQAYEHGAEVAELCAEHERTAYAIHARLRKLGLIE